MTDMNGRDSKPLIDLKDFVKDDEEIAEVIPTNYDFNDWIGDIATVLQLDTNTIVNIHTKSKKQKTIAIIEGVIAFLKIIGHNDRITEIEYHVSDILSAKETEITKPLTNLAFYVKGVLDNLLLDEQIITIEQYNAFFKLGK